MAHKPVKIAEPKGKLGVLIPGMGAVATTFIAGVEAVRRALARPIGSLCTGDWNVMSSAQSAR